MRQSFLWNLKASQVTYLGFFSLNNFILTYIVLSSNPKKKKSMKLVAGYAISIISQAKLKRTMIKIKTSLSL